MASDRARLVHVTAPAGYDLTGATPARVMRESSGNYYAVDDATATPTRAKLVRLLAPATKSATAVTAAFGGDVAHVDPTDLGVAITQPDMPRALVATIGAGWGATNHIKIYGTDINDIAITETLNANPNSTRSGVKAFKTVTKITKAITDAAGGTNTCSIGTLDVFGVAGQIADDFADGHLLTVGFDPITVDVTNNTIAPTTASNGARTWHVHVNLTYP